MRLFANVACFSAIVFSASMLHAEDSNAYAAFGQARAALAQETYGSALSNGVNALDLVIKTLKDKIVSFIPEPAGFYSFETNDYYMFNDESGSFGWSILAEKVFTNTSSASPFGRYLRVQVDTTLSSMERWDSLSKSWRLLLDRGSYQLISNRRATNDQLSILDNSTIYVPVTLSETNGSVNVGFLMKIDMDMVNLTNENDRVQTATLFLQEYLQKLPLKSMRWYLQ